MERSKRLHNFNLPYLRWGHQRYLRCVKLHQHPLLPRSSSSTLSDRCVPNSAASVDRDHPGGEGNAGVRVEVSVVADERNDELVAKRPKPWNLRTRRAACYDPRNEKLGISLKKGKDDEDGGGGGCGVWKEKKLEKVKFSVPLLKEEIEEDFAAMIGKRPPRRPKKRPRIVQKQLNSLFPGLWLTEDVTVDSYHVPENPET